MKKEGDEIEAITSRHGSILPGSKQSIRNIKMAAVTIAALVYLFAEEKRSIERGEDHYRSDHAESFAYVGVVIKGTVHASMKKSYNVMVSAGL